MRLSVVAPLWQDAAGQENLDVAARADALGYRSMWVGEMATYDAFALATAIGIRTGLSLTIGPLAVGVRTPVTMAMGVASVSDLTGRPARLAIGASSPVVVKRWHGRAWHDTAEHLREAATTLKALLAGERSAHDGRLASSRGFRLRLDPPGADLTVAAFGPASLAVAGAVADRVVLNMLTVDAAGRFVGELRRLAAEASRPMPAVAVWLVAAIDPTEAARRQMAMARVPYLAAPGYRQIIADAGYRNLVELARSRPHPRELAAAVPPGLDEALGLVGDVSAVRARLADYAAAGVDEVCLVPVTAGDPGGERTLAGALTAHSDVCDAE